MSDSMEMDNSEVDNSLLVWKFEHEWMQIQVAQNEEAIEQEDTHVIAKDSEIREMSSKFSPGFTPSARLGSENIVYENKGGSQEPDKKRKNQGKKETEHSQRSNKSFKTSQLPEITSPKPYGP